MTFLPVAVQVEPPPAPSSLVALRSLNEHLGLEPSSSESAVLSALAGAAAAISTYCGRELNRSTWRIPVGDGGGSTGREVVARVFPLGTVLRVFDEAEAEMVGISHEGLRVSGRTRSRLICPAGWFDVKVSWLELTAGFPDPAGEVTWSAGTALVNGQWRFGAGLLRWFVVAAGATGGTEPVWAGLPGDTIQDGGVLWRLEESLALPADLEYATLLAAAAIWRGEYKELPVGIAREAGPSGARTYRDTCDFLPPVVQRAWAPWRCL